MDTDGARRLADIVGAEHVRGAQEATGAAAGALVARPGSVEETCRVVALAHERGWTVLPRGAGSWPPPFPVLPAPDLLLELRRLDRIVRHVPEDLVASVECGLALPTLQRALGEHGQRVPLDPPGGPETTVGGVLASNRFGPRRLRYGTARDWVIGTELVRFDGKLVKAGGMVVKNVSGYDLGKLYVGSWGSLGVLVRANFKLDPLPAAEEVLELELADRGAAGRVFAAARAGPFALDSAVLLRGPAARGGSPVCRLFLGLAGRAEAIASHAARLEPLALTEGALAVRRVAGEAAAALRARLSAAPCDPGDALRVRMSYPPAAIEDALAAPGAPAAIDAARETSLLGSGVTWLGWRDADAGNARSRVEALERALAGLGGWLAVERQPGRGPERLPAWRLGEPERALMQRIKTALDPTGTFVGGVVEAAAGPAGPERAADA